MLFAPIHWSEANASTARVGALVAPFTDPFSGQPENKATPASIAPYEYVFRGFALSRVRLELPPCLVGARRCYRLASAICSPTMPIWRGWQSWLRSVRRRRSRRIRDFGGGIYRAASFAADRIDTCLFVGPAHDAGDWDVVKRLFAVGFAQRRAAPDAAVGQIQRRAGQRRAHRLRLLRRRPRHHLRQPSPAARAPRPRSAHNSRPAPIAAPASRN